MLSKGDFVEYDVEYTDAVAGGYEYTSKNGWRLLDYTDNGDGTLSNVRLISTGLPARLEYSSSYNTDSSWWIRDNDKLNEFRNFLGGDDYEFCKVENSGFSSLQVSAGLYYNFGDIKFAYGVESRGTNLGYFTKIKTNGVTYDINNTEENIGEKIFIPEEIDATLSTLTLPEINKAIGREDIDSIEKISKEEDPSGLYVYNKVGYWLASPKPNTKCPQCVVLVSNNGRIMSTWDIGYNMPVRPVICLKSKVQLVDTNSDGVWEIKQ